MLKTRDFFKKPVTEATVLLSVISLHVCIFLQYVTCKTIMEERQQERIEAFSVTPSGVTAESNLGLSGHKLKSDSWITLL